MTPSCKFSPDKHLNKNIAGLSTSATVAIHQHCRKLLEEGTMVYRLGLGQSPFPVPELVVKALQQNAHQKEYLPVKGLPELRQVLANQYYQSFDINCDTRNIIIGPGSKELMFLLQLIYDGEIMIPMPAWVSYLPQARIVGRQVNTIMTSYENSWKITPDQLEAICRLDPGRARLLILNYPSNPTGQTYSKEELVELASVFRKYKILVLSDEIYGKITFDNSHTSLVTIYPEGTILSSGLSKWCGAGGWRLGYFVVPQCTTWLSDAMATVASETYTSTSAPIQYAAITAFQSHLELDNYVLQCRTILERLSIIVMEILTTADIKVLPPCGGFYVFPDFCNYRDVLATKNILTNKDFCQQLLADTGVAILPGSDFGRDESELTARIAFIDFDGKEALTNYPQDNVINESYIYRYCGKTIEAVKRITDWLKNLQ